MYIDPQKYPALYERSLRKEETTMGIDIDPNFESEGDDLGGTLMAHSLGDALKRARQMTGFTGAAAGKAAGFNRQRVSQLENVESGKIELTTLVKYLGGLGYDLKLVITSQEKNVEIVANL